ncbi:MAG: aromatic aminobenezylarsenical efflux permease ArsG family transporter [Candidatus Shapirobacteria bacterium]|jgi:cytochrome c biogenesis protein CcdA
MLNYLIDTYNIPLLSAFLIGVMTSISPCPLATNITAIAFISKDIKSSKQTLLNGIFYTLGRGISYTLLATLIYFGLSSFSISSIFQGWGDKVFGPILIIIGLIMADFIKINLKTSNPKIDQIKLWLAKKGYIGSLLLGMLFALAFCPYSGVLFFGILIPMVIKSSGSLLLPPLFALGTGLPVILFSFLIAFSVKKISVVFNKIQKFEAIVRKTIAFVFIVVGLYYCQFLLKFILNII